MGRKYYYPGYNSAENKAARRRERLQQEAQKRLHRQALREHEAGLKELADVLSDPFNKPLPENRRRVLNRDEALVQEKVTAEIKEKARLSKADLVKFREEKKAERERRQKEKEEKIKENRKKRLKEMAILTRKNHKGQLKLSGTSKLLLKKLKQRRAAKVESA
eukprot:Blabericola_migrator_1__2103@NODE_157_length_12604_cov_91_609237_g137_i0_p6_GENE_NODE_157_length_12604_cov_91_609237_g137_i0NODE_157_length_12604_cov_91_609237_g137_i0_p6_ORF_typecomplete_len163_score38_10rRNA_processing/PF08524_11/1_4e03rRNA_processing/PF08524_11/1_6e05DUF1874/PF08960_10/0_27DUF1874/PF08960_10/7_8e02_NODE_157_length_12604_cov_91_609237_g137_i0962910117